MAEQNSTIHPPVTERIKYNFFQKVAKTCCCWIWYGGRHTSGYGSFRIGRRTYHAHQASWIIHFDWPKNKLFVLHTCDNPLCVKPDHLYLGTAKDNARDAKERGRAGIGGRNGKAKITVWKMAEIKDLFREGWDHKSLADKFCVSEMDIEEILLGKQWEEIFQ